MIPAFTLDVDALRALVKAAVREVLDEERQQRPAALNGPTNQLPRWLTVAGAAKELNVCQRTVREWIRRGGLEASKIGRHLRIAREDLEHFVGARRSRRATEAEINAAVERILAPRPPRPTAAKRRSEQGHPSANGSPRGERARDERARATTAFLRGKGPRPW